MNSNEAKKRITNLQSKKLFRNKFLTIFNFFISSFTMRKLKKVILYFILCYFINIGKTTAQIFLPKDSLRKHGVIQVGLGVYYGLNHIKPVSPNFTYNTNDGYDKGALISLRVNLTKHFDIEANYRISQQTCMIGMQNEAFYESFHLTGNTINIPLSLRYNIFRKQQQMLTLLMGIGYQKTKYSTSNAAFDIAPGYGLTTTRGDGFINEANFKYLNYTVGVSKEIYLLHNIQFNIFSEVTFFNNPIVKENGVYNFNQNTINKYYTEFKQWNSRIGIILLK